MTKSNVGLKEKQAQMKRTMSFALIILMVMSLTMCGTPGRGVIHDDVYLTQVDPEHELPEGWLDSIELVTAENSLGESFQIEKETIAHFEGLQAALKEDGIEIEIGTAYHSAEEQKNYPDEYPEHQTGLAVDIMLVEEGKVIRDTDLAAKEEVLEDIHVYLADYGFVVSVLPGREELCGGLPYKPWHIRYVGVEAARQMAGRGIVLQEYLEGTAN